MQKIPVTKYSRKEINPDTDANDMLVALEEAAREIRAAQTRQAQLRNHAVVALAHQGLHHCLTVDLAALRRQRG